MIRVRKQNREQKTIKKMKENKIRLFEQIKKIYKLFNRLTMKKIEKTQINKSYVRVGIGIDYTEIKRIL